MEAKAASLLFGLARNHAFIDGNKRIAVLSTLQFLNLNGYDLDLMPVEEAYKTVVQAASGSLALDDLTGWIRDRIKPLSRAVACVILGPTAADSLWSDDFYRGWVVECVTCGTTETVMEPDDWDAAAESLKSQMAEHVRLGHPDYELRFAEVVDGACRRSVRSGLQAEGGPADRGHGFLRGSRRHLTGASAAPCAHHAQTGGTAPERWHRRANRRVSSRCAAVSGSAAGTHSIRRAASECS